MPQASIDITMGPTARLVDTLDAELKGFGCYRRTMYHDMDKSFNTGTTYFFQFSLVVKLTFQVNERPV